MKDEIKFSTVPFEEISVCNGKYTIRSYSNGRMNALRYNQPWRDLTGDGMVLAMFHEIQKLREDNAKLTEFASQFSKWAEVNPKIIAPWKIGMDSLVESVKPLLPLSP